MVGHKGPPLLSSRRWPRWNRHQQSQALRLLAALASVAAIWLVAQIISYLAGGSPRDSLLTDAAYDGFAKVAVTRRAEDPPSVRAASGYYGISDPTRTADLDRQIVPGRGKVVDEPFLDFYAACMRPRQRQPVNSSNYLRPGSSSFQEQVESVQHYLASPQFESRRAEIGRLPSRGIVINAGGAKLLTSAVVLLGVLRWEMNCTLPVHVFWHGAREMDDVTWRFLQVSVTAVLPQAYWCTAVLPAPCRHTAVLLLFVLVAVAVLRLISPAAPRLSGCLLS